MSPLIGREEGKGNEKALVIVIYPNNIYKWYVESISTVRIID
jgi:hypothetical protein